MIGHSVPEYIFIRISITALRLIAPLSIVYLLACYHTHEWLLSPWIAVYAIVEAVFFIFVYLPRSRFMQKAAEHPPLLSKEEREALFSKCFSQVRDIDAITGWFLFSAPNEILRQNVVEWLSWALFHTDGDGLIKEWEEEIDTYIQKLESVMGRKLKSGTNGDVRCIKVTMDPVVSLHRPFIWYMVVSFIDSYAFVLLASNGFTHYLQHNWYMHFPWHLFAYWATKSPAPGLSYWYRPHRSKTKHPVLFLHGIGIGLWTYLPFFLDIMKEDPEVGIIAIEILPISMRMSPPPLNRFAMLEAIATILDYHKHRDIVLSAHSYGTIIAAHILKDSNLQNRVVASVLVDPIPFLLHLPSVAFNFLYREPKTANEWQLWYFASRDPDIARTLTRHFFWIENILWKDELAGRQVGVVLSGRDQIVDSKEVWRYLTEESAGGLKFHWANNGLEIFYYPDLDHSKVFDTKGLRKPLVDMIIKFAGKDVRPDDDGEPGQVIDSTKETTPLMSRQATPTGYAEVNN